MTFLIGRQRITMEIDIAKMINFSYDNKTGKVFITMEVIDPTWKSKIMREFDKLEVKLVIEEGK